MSKLFHLPLSTQTFDQYQKLTSLLVDTLLRDGKDIWLYIWGSTMFAPNRAYLQLMDTGTFTWRTNGSVIPIANLKEKSSSSFD
jgi:hypothetical protein